MFVFLRFQTAVGLPMRGRRLFVSVYLVAAFAEERKAAYMKGALHKVEATNSVSDKDEHVGVSNVHSCLALITRKDE